MPRRVLTNEFDLTLGRDELVHLLSLVRRDIRDCNDKPNNATSVWGTRERMARNIEEKIVISYNTTGTKIMEPRDDIEAEEQMEGEYFIDQKEKDNA